VDLDALVDAGPPTVLHPGLPAVVVGLAAEADDRHPGAVACDVVLPPGDPALDAIVATAERCPVASFALVALLRGAPRPLAPSWPPGWPRGRRGRGRPRATPSPWSAMATSCASRCSAPTCATP
jgi:hypothetical protein